MTAPTVRLIIGASAYAVITTSERSLDVLLSAGRGAPQSLRESAAEMRAKAQALVGRAALCEAAAAVLASKDEVQS